MRARAVAASTVAAAAIIMMPAALLGAGVQISASGLATAWQNIATAAAAGGKAAEYNTKSNELDQAAAPLTPDDEESYRYLEINGLPDIPLRCEKGRRDLETQVFALEKLRAIGRWTEKFTEKSIAFGDSTSSIHGFAGMYWQTQERPKIQASYDNFTKQYDNKQKELISGLKSLLVDVSACADPGNPRDWYNHGGVAFYQAMLIRSSRK